MEIVGIQSVLDVQVAGKVVYSGEVINVALDAAVFD